MGYSIPSFLKRAFSFIQVSLRKYPKRGWSTEYDRLLETLQRVIEKRRSQCCEEAQLNLNPELRLAYASPQKLKKHVWDEDGDGCTTCNASYSYVVAILCDLGFFLFLKQGF